MAHATQQILDSFLRTREELATQLTKQAEILLRIKEKRDHGVVTDYQTRENVTNGELDAVGSLEFGAPRNSNNREEASVAQSAIEWQIEDQVRLLMIEDGVLGNLSFPTLCDRRESLEMPFGDTFQWIYNENPSPDNPWSSFLEWVRAGNGIYWINGKIGSGKSTLMRYIVENPQTKLELSAWAGNTPLEVAQFYFWRSGDENQKSLEGILRSLLFDILQRHRQILPTVLPDLWQFWSARATSVLSTATTPKSNLSSARPYHVSLRQLKRSMEILLQELQKTHKVALFIDGLDEHESDDDYYDIGNILQQCTASPNVKVCTSSRPLPVFEQMFAGRPSLRLQDLTRDDIFHYVDSKLRNHRYMAELSRKYGLEVTKLIEEIVRKAKGVFLWVALVIKSLLRGFGDYNRISDLKRRIQYLPEDLEELYEYILLSVDPFYHEQTSRLFQIVRAAQRTSFCRVTLLHLSWADEEDESLAETSAIRPYTNQEIEERCHVMDARLKSVCAGLLESNDNRYSSIAPDSRVSFLHRTVADWLSKPKVWFKLTSRTSRSEFSPNLAMLRSRVLCLKSLEVSSKVPLDMSIISDALEYARDAENDWQRSFPRLLDQLDTTATKHWRDCKGISLNGDIAQAESGEHLFNSMSSLQELDIRQNPSNGAGALHHWTWAIGIPGIKLAGTVSNFVDITNNMGVTRYAEEKLATGFLVDQDVNHHLLKEALRGSSSSNPMKRGARDGAPDCETIRQILGGGTDPNLSYNDGPSPWEDTLVNAARHLVLVPKLDRDLYWEETAEIWMTIIELLVDHGADLNLVTRRQVRLPGRPKLSLSSVVEYFPDILADRGAQLLLALSTEEFETIKYPTDTLDISKADKGDYPQAAQPSFLKWLASVLGH